MIQSWLGNAKCLMEVCPVSCLVSKQQGLPANSSTDAMSFLDTFLLNMRLNVRLMLHSINMCVLLLMVP